MRPDASMDVRGASRIRLSIFVGSEGPRRSEGESRIQLEKLIYILVIVNEPDPVQPELPVRVHVPEMVLPLTAPDRVKELPVGMDDCTVMPNLPLALPLKFPPNVNEPGLT